VILEKLPFKQRENSIRLLQVERKMKQKINVPVENLVKKSSFFSARFL